MKSRDTKFVVVEGLDRSGKSTLIDNLQERLEGNWIITQEPSKGPYGKLLRTQLAKDEEPSVSDLFLFLADRYDHIKNTIEPAFENGDIDGIITDRYHLSTLAYQSGVIEKQLNVKSGANYINTVTRNFHIYPDLTIILDVSVDESISRMDGQIDKYEDREHLIQARNVYTDAEQRFHYTEMIDGDMSEKQVTEAALDLIDDI